MAHDPIGDLVCDLMELRRGHGLLAQDAPHRASRTVRELCGVEDHDDEALIRQKMINRLAALTMALPDGLRPVVGAALALPSHTQERFLHQRMIWAAKQIDRDHPRTAQRRLDPGLRLLAEQLIIRAKIDATPDLDWHTVELNAVLRMDLDPPVLLETRTIRTLVDSLDEVTAQLTLPPNPGSARYPKVKAAMAFGGEIVDDGDGDRTSLLASFPIRFASPLVAGETHQYSIEFTGPPQLLFRPMYVMEPLRRCDRLNIQVKFSPDAPPAGIWRVPGLTPREVDEHRPTDQPIRLNNVGEATATFAGLLPGLSYGIQWDPALPGW